MVSEAGGVKDFSSASHPLHSPPALELHSHSFYVTNREGMDLLGGDLTNPGSVRCDSQERELSVSEKELLHYYFKEAMEEK